MAILRARSVRKHGTWTKDGDTTDVQVLRDGDDATGFRSNPVAVGDRLVLRLQNGGVPEEGEFTLRLRGRRVNGAVRVVVTLSQGDPGDGDRDTIARFEVDVGAALGNVARNIARAKQRDLDDANSLWMVVRVISHDEGASLFLVDARLVVNDDPVGTWGDLSTKPAADTQVWCRMGDGRARQGRLVDGEWEDGAGNPIEVASSMFPEDEDGDQEASRWVNGWGDI